MSRFKNNAYSLFFYNYDSKQLATKRPVQKATRSTPVDRTKLASCSLSSEQNITSGVLRDASSTTKGNRDLSWT